MALMQATFWRIATRAGVRTLFQKQIIHDFHRLSSTPSPFIILDRYKSLKAPRSVTRNMSSAGPIYTAEYLSNKLKTDLQAEHLDIEDQSNCGCGMKFDALIVSSQFEGKSILQRQRLVNQVLSEEMKHIHAFTMRTITPTQWKAQAMSS